MLDWVTISIEVGLRVGLGLRLGLGLGLVVTEVYMLLQRNLISDFLGKKPDILFDSLTDLVYDRVERSDLRLKVIQE